MSSPVFIGREGELKSLRDALDRAASGKAQAVLLAGDSGIGKTRLLDEFRLTIDTGSGRWMAGECVALSEGELPYAPIIGALRGIAGELQDFGLTAGSAPELTRLVLHGGPAPADETPGLFDGDIAQGRLFGQFVALLDGLAAEHPVILAVEDLHWADRSTRDLLSFVLRDARKTRLLLICTYRSDELHRRHPLRPFLAEQDRLESVERVELRRLTRSEIGAQLASILGSEPDAALAARLFERSEGNPFFAEELLAALADGERFPPTVRDALILRVEALSVPTQEVLRAAAAAGRRVSHDLLAAVAGLPEQQLIEAVREAVGHQVLVQDPDQVSYAFRHALLGEAVYADLLPGERTRLHLALAKALEADAELAGEPGNAAAELAFHWRACHRLEDALAASIEAGRNAEESYAFAEAGRHFENTLELWDRVEDAEQRAGMSHPATLLRAAQNANWSGQAQRAVALARSAVTGFDAAEDPVDGGLARERLGEFMHLIGDSDGALSVLDEAVELLPAEPPTAGRARVLSAQGRLLMLHGQPQKSRSRCEEAIKVARRAGDRAEEGWALNTLGCDLMLLGDRESAKACLREAMQIAAACSRGDLWRAYANLAEVLDQDGRLEEGVELGLEGAEIAESMGQRSWMGWNLSNVAHRLWRLGRLDEAQRLAARGLEALEESIDAAFLHGVAAGVDLQRGDLERAEIRLEQAAKAGGRTGDSQVRAMLADLPAQLAVLRGDPDRAAAIVDETIVSTEDEFVFYTGSIYAIGVRAHADRAERARALGDAGTEAQAEESATALIERLERLLEPTRWLVSAPPETMARGELAAAELERLRGASDPESWSAVAGRWGQLGFPLEVAYADWRKAAAILAAGGTRAEASEPLREGARLTAECGASLLGREIEALARRARIELSEGVEAASAEPAAAEVERFGLTDRELGVLALIAEGRTNREIGEILFIAPKTASAHVSHILAKLDVRSRVEAATTAHRLGLLPLDAEDQTDARDGPGTPTDPLNA